MIFRNSRAFFLAGAFGAALIPTSPAWAQTASASADADGVLASADIIVTASKRETRLQETPASITALSGNLLQSASITGVNDLAKAVPGLTVNDGGAGQRRITLRGVRSAGEAQVGIYYDEAPVASPPGTTTPAAEAAAARRARAASSPARAASTRMWSRCSLRTRERQSATAHPATISPTSTPTAITANSAREQSRDRRSRAPHPGNVGLDAG